MDAIVQLADAANECDGVPEPLYAEWIEINWQAQCLALRNTFRPLAFCEMCSLYKPVQGLFVPLSPLGVDVWWPRVLTATPSTRTLIILYQRALLYAISSLPLVSLSVWLPPVFVMNTMVLQESQEWCVKVERGHAVKASPWSGVDTGGRLVWWEGWVKTAGAGDGHGWCLDKRMGKSVLRAALQI